MSDHGAHGLGPAPESSRRAGRCGVDPGCGRGVTACASVTGEMTSAPDWVRGKRLLITGAAGLLGLALVEEAVRQGATVAATGREPRLSRTMFPAGVHAIAADLVDPGQCGPLVDRAAEALGGLDVLVNNAAVLVRRRFAELSLDDLEQAWAVNLRAPALLMQAARPYLERGSAPAIVNVVSTAGISGGVARVSAYGMTKAGLIVLTKAVAREFGPRGIRVNCVSPPTLDSRMQASLSDEERETVHRMNVLGRPAELREIALATLFLASPYASFITGTTIDASAVVP